MTPRYRPPAMTALALESAVRTDVGPVRRNNEDAAYASPRSPRWPTASACSDGLTDYAGEDAIAAALEIEDRGACAQRLVGLALAAGARDNVCVIVADVVARPDARSAWD